MSDVQICLADSTGRLAAARELMREYQQALGIDLGFQDFEAELAGLPGDYAAPDGRLFLAESGPLTAGCAAFRRLDSATAEMKRLYLRGAFRGQGLGRRLAVAVIDAARTAGYRRLVLDTLPSMADAQALYQSLGFRDTAAYTHNPIAGTRFMALDLGPPAMANLAP